MIDLSFSVRSPKKGFFVIFGDKCIQNLSRQFFSFDFKIWIKLLNYSFILHQEY